MNRTRFSRDYIGLHMDTISLPAYDSEPFTTLTFDDPMPHVSSEFAARGLSLDALTGTVPAQAADASNSAPVSMVALNPLSGIGDKLGAALKDAAQTTAFFGLGVGLVLLGAWFVISD